MGAACSRAWECNRGWGCAWPACQELVWLAALVITMPRLVPSFLSRRREVKRRHDADYENEEHPGAKRGPAAAGAASGRSRFGIRPPAAAAALAAACPVSESEVGGCAGCCPVRLGNTCSASIMFIAAQPGTALMCCAMPGFPTTSMSHMQEPVPTGEDGMRLVGLPGHLKTIEVRLLLAFLLPGMAAAAGLQC